MAFESEQLLTLIIAEAPLQLAWSFPPSTFTAALDINRLDALDDGCAIILPDATLNPTAQSIRFYNVGEKDVEIQLFGGIPLLDLLPGEYYQFSLVDNSTQAGNWISVPYVAGAVNISNFTIASDVNNSITVLNGNVTATGQTVTIQQPLALEALVTPADTNLSFKGMLAYDPNAGTPIYYSRVLTSADGNIVITNGDGTDGAPTFSLSPDLTNLNSFSFGNTTYTAQGITSSGTDIVISTGDTSGTVTFNGTTADATGNLNVSGALTAAGGISSPSTSIAWARMTDTTTGETNVLVIPDAFNASIAQTVEGTGGTYTLTMPTPAANTYYGVQFSCGTESTTVPPLFAQVIYSSATPSQFTFIVTDAGGTIVSEVPNSLTVTVFSTGDGNGNSAIMFSAYANMYMNQNPDITTISTGTDTPPVAGTTVAGLLRDFTMPASNKLVYVGVRPIKATVRGVASVMFTSTFTDPFNMTVTVNDILVEVPQYCMPVAQDKLTSIAFEVDVNLTPDDYLRVVIGTDPNPTPPYTLNVAQMNVTVQSVS